jgi:hypothetical protein
MKSIPVCSIFLILTISIVHNQREKIPLNESEEEGFEDEAFDEAVMDLPSSGGESEKDDNWGRSKKTFYSADMAAEDLKDEANEARKLQKKQLSALKEEDFGKKMTGTFGIVSLDLSDEECEEEFVKDRFGSDSELVELDGESLEKILPDEEKLALVEKYAPEVSQFLVEFRKRIKEIRETLEPLLIKMRGGTERGLCFLETKYQLLIGYCANLAYYILLKTQGKNIANHPVVSRLVKYRLLIEKIKPMETKLQYHVDKLLQAAVKNPEKTDDGDDMALVFRPNLEMMDATDSEDDVELYKAPKVAPAHYADKKTNKTEDREKVLASRSRMLADIQAEFEDRPEEDLIDAVYGRTKDNASSKHRDDYEEDNFVRFTLTKAEQRKLEKAQSKPIDELEDLNDFVKETSDRPKSNGKSAIDRLLGIKTARTKKTSGDDDVPVKRAKNEKTGRNVRINEDDQASDMSEIEDDMEGEDDFYRTAKQNLDKKKNFKPTQKNVAHKPIRDGVGEARPATYAMLKNKGLTPNRPKEDRNPRVKHRMKWERAQKKIKSFKPIVQQQAKPYRGEASGIRTNVSRSVKF